MISTGSGHYTWNLVPEQLPTADMKEPPTVETSEISVFAQELRNLAQKEVCKLPEFRWGQSEVKTLEKAKELAELYGAEDRKVPISVGVMKNTTKKILIQQILNLEETEAQERARKRNVVSQ